MGISQKSKFVWYGIAVVVLAGFIGVGVSMTNGLGKSTADTGCSGVHGKARLVTIHDSKVSAANTAAKRCDTLTIINSDPIVREIAFGQHDHHVAYDGVSEKSLAQNQSLTIRLDKAGEYHFHDHLHDEVEGYFTVTK